MDINLIMNCSMSNCAYNSAGMCRTPAITVGPHAECSTFINASPGAGFKEVNGSIGACQAVDCAFNDRLECTSATVKVTGHDLHADCATFRSKK